jgi:hypothetical protein
LFGGWRVGIIGSMQSGAVFTVYSLANQTNAFTPGNIRADLTGDPRSGQQTIARWFNTSAFANAAPFRFGNSGRGILEGPGLANVDSSFAKQFPIKENWRAEVRAEFFNLFNRANFSLPNATVNSPNYGIINAAAAARSGQLAFRIDF